MSYFSNFPLINYTFGDQPNPTVYQNLGVYVDLVDQAKNDAAFYTYYNLKDGDRPDQISELLYGRSDLHWTFPILNDNIKLQGWPIRNADLLAKAKADYPNVTINTRTDITETFKIGSIITGNTSGSSAVILRKRLDFGQLIVGRISVDRQLIVTTDVKGYVKLELTTPGERFVESGDWQILLGAAPSPIKPTIVSGGVGYSFVEYNFGIAYANLPFIFNLKVMNFAVNPGFVDGEVITTDEEGITRSAIVDTSSAEYLATHHYEDADGNYVDITPNAPFVQKMTFSIEAAGDSESEIAAAEVKSLTISTIGDYTSNIPMTNVQRNIDRGFYKFTGSLFKVAVKTNNDFVVDNPLDLGKLTGIDGTENSYFVDHFPEDTDFTELYSQLNTTLSSIIAVTDPNNSSKYDITINLFFIVDNQLNVYLETDVFGITYEYTTLSTKTYLNKFTNGTTSTVTTPAPTTRAEALEDNVTQLESHIQQNLSTFNPAVLTQVTYLDRYEKSNNALKSIRVLRPSVAEDIVKTFQDVLIESQQDDTGQIINTTNTGTGNVQVTGSSQPVTTFAGQTITTSSAAAISNVGSTSTGSGGYY